MRRFLWMLLTSMTADTRNALKSLLLLLLHFNTKAKTVVNKLRQKIITVSVQNTAIRKLLVFCNFWATVS